MRQLKITGLALLLVALATSAAQAAPKARSMQISMLQAYHQGLGCDLPLIHRPPYSYPACPPIPMSGRDTTFDAISFGSVGVFNLRFDATGKDVKVSWFAKDVLDFGLPLTGPLRVSLDVSLTGNKCNQPDYGSFCTVLWQTVTFDIGCDAGICKGKTTLNAEMKKRGFPDLIVPRSDTRLEIQNVSVVDTDFGSDVAFYQGLLVR